MSGIGQSGTGVLKVDGKEVARTVRPASEDEIRRGLAALGDGA